MPYFKRFNTNGGSLEEGGDKSVARGDERKRKACRCGLLKCGLYAKANLQAAGENH